MKFSFNLIKKLAPSVKNKSELIEKFNFYAFEAADLGGDVLDIAIPANRFSDASSHVGIAREAAAIFNSKLREVEFLKIDQCLKIKPANFSIRILEKRLCPRYAGWYFENIEIGSSPEWMQKTLISCGLRPINNVVDIMNYVMLEIGQPLHAFDFDKIKGAISNFQFPISKQIPNSPPASSPPAGRAGLRRTGKFPACAEASADRQIPKIIVRRAKKGEKITTLDNETYELDNETLVIADDKEPLAVAGIKGGKKAEVDDKTKRIVVEAASFNGTNIYKTSKRINLATDASLRFSHNLSPALVEIGIKRAAKLLIEFCGAKAGSLIDVCVEKPVSKIIKFDINRFNQLTGLEMDVKTAANYLKRLGFQVKDKLVTVPMTRVDISIFEDVAEEVVRLYGYNKLPVSPPKIYLRSSGFEEQIKFKDKIKNILTGFGLGEVYNYSFISKKDFELCPPKDFWGGRLAELQNPVSSQFQYLRPSLTPHLLRDIEDNFRFCDSVRIFEIGKVFQESKTKEKLMLGIALGVKKENPILELKGLIEQLFQKLGLVDYFMPDLSARGGSSFGGNFLNLNESLRVESDHQVLGYLGSAVDKYSGKAALAEIDLEKLLKLVVEEREFEPLSKYPSAMRDLSFWIDGSVRINKILEAIQDASPEFINDVDLADFYENPNLREERQSLTFRIVFQADDHTFTDEEVGREMEKIISVLRDKFGIETR